MSKLRYVSILGVAMLFVCSARAQTDRCASTTIFHNQIGYVGGASPHVACTVPQLYGYQGLVAGASDRFDIPVFFDNPIVHSNVPISTNYLGTLNKDIATQLALLPLVSPAQGISLTFDRSLGAYTVSTDSFGPIFSERASTIGRHRLSIGASYQYQKFDTVDGINLHNFPTAYIYDQQQDRCSQFNDPQNVGICAGLRDYFVAENRIDLRVSQINTYATFGITKNIDISVSVPFVSIKMAATADTHIVQNGGGISYFATGGPRGECADAVGSMPCYHKVFTNAQHASGIGDITVRGKATVKRWERAGMAAGVDVRIPTGESFDFLGSGALGIRPFVVWSQDGRISPHANFGYQWNGKSALGGDVTTGVKGSLPGELLYSAGVEAGVTRRVTATLDLVGQRLFNANSDTLTQVMAPGAICTNFCDPASPYPPTPVTTISPSTGSYGINSAALGARFNPFGKLLISADVLLKLDSGGLRSKYVPLVSAIYTFH
jgi:hypothetical protein